MMTRLYFYIQEIFRIQFVLLHELSHFIIAIIISFFITDIYISDFHIELGKFKKLEDRYHIINSSGYVRIHFNKKRKEGQSFWLFLISVAPLLFIPLWLYLFYNSHIYIFILGIMYLPTLLPSRSDCNEIYDYIGYKFLLWH